MEERMTARNFWVLGGTKGLGFQIASLAIESGNNVAILGREAETFHVIPPFDSERFWRIRYDLQDTGLSRVLYRAFEQLPVDVFVWASGIKQRRGFMVAEFGELDKLLNVNLRGPIHLLSRVVKNARRNRPLHLIVVGTIGQVDLGDNDEIVTAINAGKSVFAKKISSTLAQEIPGSRVLVVNIPLMDMSDCATASLAAQAIMDAFEAQGESGEVFRECNVIQTPERVIVTSDLRWWPNTKKRVI